MYKGESRFMSMNMLSKLTVPLHIAMIMKYMHSYCHFYHEIKARIQ